MTTTTTTTPEQALEYIARVACPAPPDGDYGCHARGASFDLRHKDCQGTGRKYPWASVVSCNCMGQSCPGLIPATLDAIDLADILDAFIAWPNREEARDLFFDTMEKAWQHKKDEETIKVLYVMALYELEVSDAPDNR